MIMRVKVCQRRKSVPYLYILYKNKSIFAEFAEAHFAINILKERLTWCFLCDDFASRNTIAIVYVSGFPASVCSYVCLPKLAYYSWDICGEMAANKYAFAPNTQTQKLGTYTPLKRHISQCREHHLTPPKGLIHGCHRFRMASAISDVK